MKKIALFVASLTLLSSCSLDREPETTLSDTNFWQTSTDFRGACNRMYNQLGGFGHDYRSDEIIGNSQNATSSGNWTLPATSGDWTNPYNHIGVANNIIQKGEAARGIPEPQINRWMAEARFFRAYNYFDLVKKYGDVPLILKAFSTTEDPEIKKARTPRAEVVAQILSDLDYAAEWLPDIDQVGSDADWGRVSRSAALALTVRVGLYEGTYAKFHHLQTDYKPYLQKAIAAAETMMREGKHSLYPDYQKLFYFDGEGRRNKENVFVKVYGPNDAGTVTHNNSRTLENAASVTRQTIDRFLYEDGLPKEKSPLAIADETSYDDVFSHRDKRLEMTIYKLSEEAYKGGYMPFTNQHGNGYPIKKCFMLDQWQLNGKETVDKMLIRYAEVLLSYAEALYELNGSISDAQLDASVNVVRQRAGLNVRLTNDFVRDNGLDMQDELRRERQVEFVDEGLHYDDIIRWKTAEVVLPRHMLGIKYAEGETSAARSDLEARLTKAGGQYDGAAIYDEADIYVIEKADTRSFDPGKDYLYPIPTYEIATSEGHVLQNPGW